MLLIWRSGSSLMLKVMIIEPHIRATLHGRSRVFEMQSASTYKVSGDVDTFLWNKIGHVLNKCDAQREVTFQDLYENYNECCAFGSYICKKT